MDTTSVWELDSFTPGACDDLSLYVPLDDTTPFCDWS